ncbi:MAG: phosphoglucosamine mutase, partial [Myxococcales bacterium]|nr:phosphoglucosamine mutase [Myxococcales bacterium]
MGKDKRRYFGTDGIRGKANAGVMTVETAVQIGRAVGSVFTSRHERPRVLIGKDTRRSGYLFEMALVSGACSVGAEPYVMGPLPTPGIAFLTKGMRADVGVVISASHNSFEDNGIKLFGPDGYKLPDEVELQIERFIDDQKAVDAAIKVGADIGRAYRIDDARGRYLTYLKTTFPNDLTLDGMKIALDCANGAAYRIAPTVLEELGAEVVTRGVSPNGLNINDGCGAMHPRKLAALVLQTGADLGIALDGDADRLIMVDEAGQQVDGDQILALTATRMKRDNQLAQNTLVVTVMSNYGLEMAMASQGISLVRTQVGDRYVVEAMRKGSYNLGGEQSGHIVHLDHSTTGDGTLAALRVLAIMQREQRPLSDLARVMQPAPQTLINVRVSAKPELSTMPDVTQAIADAESALAGKGRVLVRYSGTE